MLEKNHIQVFPSLVGDLSSTIKLIRDYFLGSSTEVAGIVSGREKKDILRGRQRKREGKNETKEKREKI